MKLFLKTTQVLVTLYTLTGAIYTMGHYQDLATEQALITLPPYFWIGLGVIQIILATHLILATMFTRYQTRLVATAVCLSGLSLLGSILFSAYAGFPGILWAIIPATIYAFIAYLISKSGG